MIQDKKKMSKIIDAECVFILFYNRYTTRSVNNVALLYHYEVVINNLYDNRIVQSLLLNAEDDA